MPERKTRTDTLHAGTPFTVGSITLLPIERVVMHLDTGSTRVWFAAAKEPYALVVRDAGGLRAVDTDAMAVSLAALREKIPGLDALLASM
jgi:hypothetical protein